jgi:hypothetical protein
MMPPGVRHEFGGLYQHQQIGFAGLAKEFAAALIAELILLVFLDERLWLPLPLLSTTAVFTVFWLTGVELNITALTAMTMIIGISAEMAIFYVSEFTERNACLRMTPCADRLRPITMTTLAATFTLLPLGSRLVRAPAFNSLWHRRPLPDCSSNFRRCCWPCRFCSHSRYDRSGGHSPLRSRRPLPPCDRPYSS